MTRSRRRDILLALTALGLVPAAARAEPPALGVGAKAIREAYLAAHPSTDTARLAAELLPDGWSPDAEAALRQRVAADFRNGRLFLFRGWRLSLTEGQLFVLLGAG